MNKTGMNIHDFAKATGMTKGQALYWCRKGCIEGARFNRITWQWRIYPPARFLLRRQA